MPWFNSVFLLPLLTVWITLGPCLATAARAEPAWSVRTPDGIPLPDARLQAPIPSPWGELVPSPAGRIDLGQHLLVGESGPFLLQAGRQDFPGRNLVLGEGSGRGMAFSLRGGPQQAGLAGFLLSPEEFPADPADLGLDEAENRLGGLCGAISPRLPGPASVTFSTVYLAGRRARFGEAPPAQAWTMAVDAALTGLTLRGEVAGSREHGGDNGVVEGSATSLLLSYASSLPAGRHPLDWHIGLENERIDPFFSSPAHPQLVADRDRIRLFGGTRRRGLALQGSLSRERNNVDEVFWRPIVQTDRFFLQLEAERPSFPPASGFPAVLRHPVGILGLSGFRRQAVEIPAGFDGVPADEAGLQLQTGLNFSHPLGQWGVDWSIGENRDFAGLFDSTLSRSAALWTGFHWARVIVLPRGEIRRTENRVTGEDAETVALTVNGSLLLVPDRLRGNWDFSWQRVDPWIDDASRTLRVGGEILYAWIPPRPARPGYDLSLRGSWWESETPGSPDVYRIFFGLNIVPPV